MKTLTAILVVLTTATVSYAQSAASGGGGGGGTPQLYQDESSGYTIYCPSVSKHFFCQTLKDCNLEIFTGVGSNDNIHDQIAQNFCERFESSSK